MADTKTSSKGTASTRTSKEVFTAAERAAMVERARESKAEARRGTDRAAGQADLMAKIAEMPKSDRIMAERIHAVIMATAPDLAPKTWYGMPAWANKAGKVLCFFTPAAKFKERYATFGFNADAHLDDGSMWPTAWALTKLAPADEAALANLVKKAVS